MDNSADELSNRLMLEIHSETLQQFLVPCHHQDAQYLVQFQIPSLDSYLNDEIQLHQRTRELPNIIEIQGPSGSGKTHLLYFLLASCILPKNPTLGWGKAAFVFDMDGTFCITRFRQILITRLSENTPSPKIIPLVQKYLSCVHIFRPVSSNQLDITLKSLSKHHAKLFPHLDLGMIAIHSINAFYWLDRYKTEQARMSTPSINPKISHYRNTTSVLHELLLSYNAIVVMTYWAFLGQSDTMPYSIQSTGNIHQPNEIIRDQSGDHAVNVQQRDPQWASRHQILLTAGKANSEEPSYQEIKVVAQTMNRPDYVSFKLYITQQGIYDKPSF